MSESIQPATQRQPSGARMVVRLLLIAVVVLLSGVMLRGLIFRYVRPGGVDLGTPMPEVTAAGWLNGPALTSETLRGKVVVIDFFATWCGPCRRATPELVETQQRFRDKDVVFLALTTEESDSIPQLDEFIQKFKIPWVIGYGAEETQARFKTDSIPRVWVINKAGKVTWDSFSQGTLDDAITAAL